MKKQRPGGFLYYCLTAITFAGASYGWIEFVYKPIDMSLTHGWRWVISDLLFSWRSQTYSWPLAGQIFIFLTACLALLATILVIKPVRAMAAYIEESEAPVSILSTYIHIRMMDAGFRRAEITRSQKIHANRSDVDAYHYSNTPNHGRIEPGSWDYKSLIGRKNISGKALTRTIGKKFEVIERFDCPLPTSYRVTYLPNWLVLWLFNLKFRPWFRNIIVTRENRIVTQDEYCVDDPVFQLNCIRYPATNIEIIVDFPSATAPDEGEVEGFVITDNVVKNIDVYPRVEGDRITYAILLKKLKKQQIVRLQWCNAKMNKFVADNGLPVP